MEDGQHSGRRRLMLFPCLLFLQAVLIVLFGFFVEYDTPAEPAIHGAGGHVKAQQHPVSQEEGAANSSAAGKKTAEGANGHHGSSDDDVNTLGHYYPSKSLARIAYFVKQLLAAS